MLRLATFLLFIAGCSTPYRIDWSAGPMGPRADAGHVAAVTAVGPAFLTAGGALSFDPKTRTWTAAAAAAPPDAAFAAYGESLIVVGGLVNGRSTAECARWTWVAGRPVRSALPALPEPRTAAAAAVLEHTLYVLLGAERVDFAGGDSDEMLRLDLTRPENGWVRMGAAPGSPRRHAAAAAVGGRMFVFGGLRDDGPGRRSVLKVARRFDPDEDVWVTLTDLPEPLYGLGAAALDGRHILLLGGAGQNNADVPPGRPPLPYRRRAYIYDTMTDVYHRTDEPPRPVIRSAPAVFDAKVYLFGGEDRPGGATANLQIGVLRPVEARWWK